MSDQDIYDDDNFCQHFLRDYLSVTATASDIQERGAFTSRLRGEDLPKEKKVTTAELIAAISSVKPKEAPEGVVPKTLPEHLKVKAQDITAEELSSLYDVHQGMSLVNSGTLSAIELVALHLRSYRNILDYDLVDYEALYERYCRVFSSIFSDLLTQLRGQREVSQVCELRTQTLSSDSVTHRV